MFSMDKEALQMAMDSDASTQQLSPETPKKRKVVQKTVVTVKIASKKAGKLKNTEGPPPDFWSWRKYGQKPIKGSPYPRGYYRCSTSKGCSAKKQVERCKTDGSMFIITYTSSHNHPGPRISTANFTPQDEEIQPQPSDQVLPDQDHDEKQSILSHHFHYLQNSSKDEGEEPSTVELERPSMEKIRCCLDQEAVSCSSSSQVGTGKEEENYDFFDELEELPTPPSFSSLMRSYYFDEIRIPAAPS